MLSMPRRLPITAIVPTRNEAGNLAACLKSLRFCDQVIVVDSASTDSTLRIAAQHGAEVHQFAYSGGLPRKRQWAMDNLPIRNRWTLLIDADERVTPALRRELAEIATADGPADGYWITLRLVFMGRELRHGGSGLRKLSFFRTGRGRFECLFAEQDARMSDVEIHEHVIVDGLEGQCRAAMRHENVHSLHRYIEKHNEYSTWSAELALRRRRGERGSDERKPSLFGNQAERRRWIMDRLWSLPYGGVLLPVMRFAYFYILKLGILDGVPGLYYCGFKAVQAFHIMAKVREAESARARGESIR